MMITLKHRSLAFLVGCLGACRSLEDPAFSPSSSAGHEGTDTGGTTADVPGLGSSSTGGGDEPNTVTTMEASSGDQPTSDSGVIGTSSEGGEAGESTAGESSSTGPSALPCEGQCLGSAPDGWSGPFRLTVDDPDDGAPACDDEWTALAGTYFGDLQALASTCGCSCGDPVGVSCSALQVSRHPVEFCPVFPLSGYSPIGSCTDITTVTGGSAWRVSSSLSGGSCTPSASTNIPTAQFLTRYTLCGSPTPVKAECPAGLACAPAAEQLCLVADGERAECPGAEFTEKTIVYEDFNDTRECSACTCGTPEGSCEGGEVLLHSAECPPPFPPFGTTEETTIGSSCEEVDHSVRSLRNVVAPHPEASCEPSGGVPTGDVVPTGTHTLCCQAS